MGQTNSKGSIVDRIARLEAELDELRKSAGISSAVIRRGGLSLLDDAYLRMVDDQGVEILYAGPDNEGRQIIELRREGGAPVLYTYFAGPGQQYWALTDRTENQVFADDAVSGIGIARPLLTIPTRIAVWDHLPGSNEADFETVVDTGFFDKLQPKCSVQIETCSSAADTSGEVRLMLDDVQVGATISVGFGIGFTNIAPFEVPGSFLSQHRLALQCRRTAGTGKVGASMIVKGGQS